MYPNPMTMKSFIQMISLMASFILAQGGVAQNAWTGANSSFWNDPLNWTAGVPGISSDIIIATNSTGNYPVISGNEYCHHLEIQNGAMLSLTSSGILNASGNLKNMGSFSSGGGKVVFTGTTHIDGFFSFFDIEITGTLVAPTGFMQIDGDFKNNGVFLHNNGVVDFFGTTHLTGTSSIVFFTIENYGNLTSHPIQIGLEGTFTNYGQFNHNNGLVRFMGLGNQAVVSGSEVIFNDVELDNASNGITLNGNAKIEGNLTLFNGYLDLYTHQLTLTNPSENAISYDNGFILSETNSTTGYGLVNWSIGAQTGTYSVPFGTFDQFIPVKVEVTTPGTGTGSLVLATYHTDDTNYPYPDSVTAVVDSLGNEISTVTADRFWIIEAQGFSTNPVSNLTLKAADYEVGVLDSLEARKWNGDYFEETGNPKSSLPTGSMAGNIGDYDVFVIGEGDREEQGIEEPTSIQAISQRQAVLFPNVFVAGNIQVNGTGLPQAEFKWFVTDMNGKIIYHDQEWFSEGQGVLSFDGSALTAGIYFLTITGSEESSIHPIAVRN